jgi:hypothetical protein
MTRYSNTIELKHHMPGAADALHAKAARVNAIFSKSSVVPTSMRQAAGQKASFE